MDEILITCHVGKEFVEAVKLPQLRLRWFASWFACGGRDVRSHPAVQQCDRTSNQISFFFWLECSTGLITVSGFSRLQVPRAGETSGWRLLCCVVVRQPASQSLAAPTLTLGLWEGLIDIFFDCFFNDTHRHIDLCVGGLRKIEPCACVCVRECVCVCVCMCVSILSPFSCKLVISSPGVTECLWRSDQGDCKHKELFCLWIKFS